MNRWQAWLLALLSVLPFAAARNFGEIHDDHFVRGPGSLVADPRADLGLLWRSDLFGTYEQPVRQSGFWRPLVLLGCRAQYWLTGGRDAPYAWLGHTLDILLHAVAALALWRVLLGLRLGASTALAAAALFAVHPVHPETVVWITSLGDLGAVSCAWGATALLLRPRRSPMLVAAAVALLVSALLFKESVVLLIGLAAVLPWLIGVPRRAAIGPPLIALLLYAGLRASSFTYGVSEQAWTGPVDLRVRWLTWLSIVPDLVRLSIWPGPPSPLRPVAAAETWSAPGVLAGAAVLVVLALLAASAVRRRAAAPAFATLLMLGTLLLLAPWVRFPIGYAEAAAPLYERYLYAAAAAPCLALAWGLAALMRRARVVAAALASALVLVLAAVTAARAQAWSSDESFARAGLVAAPRSPSLLTHLGVSLLDRMRSTGDRAAGDEALAAFELTLQVEPGHRFASLNRFITLGLLGRDDEAEEAADRLLQRFPDDPLVLDNVAQWHIGHRRWEHAAALLLRAQATGQALPSTAADLARCVQALDRPQAPPAAAPGAGTRGG